MEEVPVPGTADTEGWYLKIGGFSAGRVLPSPLPFLRRGPSESLKAEAEAGIQWASIGTYLF